MKAFIRFQKYSFGNFCVRGLVHVGIRFRCPQGRIKFTSRLSCVAGKRGICPTCGVRVEIPHESSRLQIAE